MARILVVDDEKIVRYSVRTALELLQHDVAEAENGADAMMLMRDDKFDLVVTDILMPVKEGIQTILEIKASLPEMKIIAITGGGRASSQLYSDAARILGADDVLLKPFTSEDLARSVDNCLTAS